MSSPPSQARLTVRTSVVAAAAANAATTSRPNTSVLNEHVSRLFSPMITAQALTPSHKSAAPFDKLQTNLVLFVKQPTDTNAAASTKVATADDAPTSLLTEHELALIAKVANVVGAADLAHPITAAPSITDDDCENDEARHVAWVAKVDASLARSSSCGQQ